MSFFVNHPHAFAKLATAADKSDTAFKAACGELAAFGIFKDAEAADTAFQAAKVEAAAALLQQQRTEAVAEASKALKGVTFSKTLTAKLVDVLETATVLDPETGEPNTPRVVLKLEQDDDGIKLVSTVVGANVGAKRSRNSSGGKAKLDGKPLTAKLIREEYGDSFAAKALDDPHKADPSRWGAKTRLNATQAVKADETLSKRLTFDS